MHETPPAPSATSQVSSLLRTAARIAWGIIGIPVALVLFALLVTIMFPVGGGMDHIMFAYSPGGNRGGARIVFVGHIIATVLVIALLRRLRYPLPWYGTAGLVSVIALWIWTRPILLGPGDRAFRMQGLLLAPLLPVAALAFSYWRERRRRRRPNAPGP